MYFKRVITLSIFLGLTLILGWFFFGDGGQRSVQIGIDQDGIIKQDSNEKENIAKEINSINADDVQGNVFIKAKYPVTQSSSVNSYLRDFVLNTISQFKKDNAWVNDEESGQNFSVSLNIDYKTYYTDKYTSYVFDLLSYTGGAHDVSLSYTLVFDSNGRNLTIRDIVPQEKLEKIAKLVRDDLLSRSGSDKTWIEQGTSADYQNFDKFYFENNNVVFIFDPYEVAPYFEGKKNVSISISNL